LQGNAVTVHMATGKLASAKSWSWNLGETTSCLTLNIISLKEYFIAYQKMEEVQEGSWRALETLQDWLAKFWNPIPDVWPSVPSIRKQIESTPEYAIVQSLGVPQQGNWRGLPLNDIVNILIKRVCSSIEERWAIRECHKLPADAELLAAHSLAARECAFDDGSNQYVPYYPAGVLPAAEPSKFYLDSGEFSQWFYAFLQARITASLYADPKLYSLEELESLIPHVDSLQYSRIGIMLRYLQDMEALKPRGEDWAGQILLLREVLGLE